MSRGGYSPIALVSIAFLLLMLPVVVFLVGQNQNPSSQARDEVPLPLPGEALPGLVVEDAYVDEDIPNRNLGETASLWADGASVKVSYFKFDLSSLAGRQISSALLRIRLNQGSAGKQSVYSVEDNAWTEESITFANRPAVGGVIASLNGGEDGDLLEIDLTAYLRLKVGGVASIAIASDDPSGLGFNSKEAIADKPELVID